MIKHSNTPDDANLSLEELAQQNIEFLAYRKQWEQATARTILTSFPLHLDIELTNACNLSCTMCWQSEYLTYPKGIMRFGLFKQIIDEGVSKGLKAIKLQSRGESMLYPKLIEAIQYAKTSGVLDVQLTTNSTFLDETTSYNLLTSGIDLLIFSIDLDHKESFEKIYPTKTYKDVIGNITGFLDQKRKFKCTKPLTRLQVLRRDGEIHPYINAVVHALEGQIDLVVANDLFQNVDDGPIDQSKFELLPCSYLWQRMVINYDGKVTMCCRDYNCEHIMGDINLESVQSVWNGEKYAHYRKLHETMERQKIRACANCEMAIKPK